VRYGASWPPALVAALLAAGGCASSAVVDVGYPAAGANRSMLASVAPRRVEIAPVTDARLDTRRIGTSSKGGKDLVTTRPVPDIVREALAVEIAKNSHAVGAGTPDAVFAAEVEEFWLDAVDAYSATQYVGRVVIALAVANGRSGDTLLARRYVGIKRRTVDTPSDSAGREVMDAALARALHDFATDAEVVAALSRLGS